MPTFYFKTPTVDFAVSTNNNLYFRNKITNIIEKYGDLSDIDISKFNMIALDSYDYIHIEKIRSQCFCDYFRNIGANDCIFVGAGFSKLSGIPDMSDLHKTFLLDKPSQLLSTIKESPQNLISRYKLFVIKMAISNPSKEHRILKVIQNKTQCRIITENIDNLLDKTGMEYVNLFQQQIEFDRPNKVFLIGVGNPFFQALFNKWDSQGTVFIALSQNKPNINISKLLWCESEISNIITDSLVI